LPRKVASTVQRLELCFVKENRRGKKKRKCLQIYVLLSSKLYETQMQLCGSSEGILLACCTYVQLFVAEMEGLYWVGELCTSMSHYLLTYLFTY